VLYGDEIGMGDDIWLRHSGVRTPMQSGLSTSSPVSPTQGQTGLLTAPVISDSIFGYPARQRRRAEAQPTSLLNCG